MLISSQLLDLLSTPHAAATVVRRIGHGHLRIGIPITCRGERPRCLHPFCCLNSDVKHPLARAIRLAVPACMRGTCVRERERVLVRACARGRAGLLACVHAWGVRACGRACVRTIRWAVPACMRGTCVRERERVLVRACARGRAGLPACVRACGRACVLVGGCAGAHQMGLACHMHSWKAKCMHGRQARKHTGRHACSRAGGRAGSPDRRGRSRRLSKHPRRPF